MEVIRLEVLDHGIVNMIWDNPKQSTNVLNKDSLDDFSKKLDQVIKSGCKGLIISSAKETFNAGADLNYIRQSTSGKNPEKSLYDIIMAIHAVFRKLETANIPVVAAINGSCLGGGYELALACHHRIMASNPKARIGLPEIKLGIFPGLGGTCRLIRMLGSEKALTIILKGYTLPSMAALNKGMVDEVCPPEKLIDNAVKWILANPRKKQPWDESRFKIPKGAVYTKSGLMTWGGANGLLRKQTFGRYPGAKAAMSAMYEGLLVNFDQALEIEAQYFSKVFFTPEAKAMVQTLFTTRSQLKKGIHRPKLPHQPTSRIGIIGAGFMGQGITEVAIKEGIPVTLIDRNEELVHKSLQSIRQSLTKQSRQGKINIGSIDKVINLIKPSVNYKDLSECDLIIEAVFENRKVKEAVYDHINKHAPKDAIIGSNTSTLPISSLASNLIHPENMIGIHFFSPVNRMELVEVIMGDLTSPTSLAKALDFLKLLKKIPIVVNDGRGFYTTRCVISYINEGLLLLTEGVSAALIENAGKMLGMPVGPLALIDEIAIELAYLIQKQTKNDLGDQFIQDPSHDLINLMVEQHQRLGRKNQKGFYDYTNVDKKLWSGLKHFEKQHNLSLEDIQERLMYRQLAEVLICKQSGILRDDRDADIGAIFGWGFLPWTGGPMSYINAKGPENIKAKLKSLAEKFGSRFNVN